MAEDLWPRVISLPNVVSAWEKVRANHGCAGVDGVTVDQLHRRRDAVFRQLRAALAAERYKPFPLRAFHIPKQSGGYRLLGVPTVRDRLAQQAVLQVMGPLLEPTFDDCSYAYRPGRSIFQALTHVCFLRDHGFTWVLDADIHAFFDEVDHALLAGLLCPLVGEPRIIGLVSSWVVSPALEHDQLRHRTRGLPQGAVISPVLANVYLTPFDRTMRRGGHQLVRYADDFLVLCASQAAAEQARAEAAASLQALGLRLNEAKTRITTFDEGFTYLGARLHGRQCELPVIRRGAYRAGAQDAPPRIRRPRPPAGWRSAWIHDHLPISALAAWAFCRRAAYLRLACGVGLETPPIIAGRVAHLQARTRCLPTDTVIHCDVPVTSGRLGLQGQLDRVEERWGLCIPVEMKWSLDKRIHEGPRLQLAAGAICLEETWGVTVGYGYVAWLPSGDRVMVQIDGELRARVERVCAELAEALARDDLPPGQPDRCRACSLRTVCLWEETAALREQLTESIGRVSF